jgi:tRNA G18 (ribose-2'-O)-methylase SpoU
MADSKRQKIALERLNDVMEAASRFPEDPGLRETFPTLPRAPIRLICSEMDKGINHGNILRVADAFRIEEVCFSPAPAKERDFSGCSAAVQWVPTRWIPASQAIEEAKMVGCHVYALSLTDEAIPLESVEWRFPAAIVLGRELEGLDRDLLKACDDVVAIPMYGIVTSLNVAVSAALAVSSCLSAYSRENPDFAPARKASQELLQKHRTPID